MDGAKAKIEWAEKRIHDLDIALDNFLNPPVGKPKPYRIAVKRDSQTGEVKYQVTKNGTVPPDIVLLAGDILQNLRTALDYAVCALTVANGHLISTQTAFPIFDHPPTSHEDYSIFCRKVCCAGSKAMDYILQTKPYKGGNEILWRLHALNIRDKHRLLLTAGLAMTDINLGQHMRATRPDLIGHIPDHWVQIRGPWILTDVGQEILIDPPSMKANENIEFKFKVAFNEPGIVEGEPMEIVLRKAFNWVSGIVWDLGKYLP